MTPRLKLVLIVIVFARGHVNWEIKEFVQTYHQIRKNALSMQHCVWVWKMHIKKTQNKKKYLQKKGSYDIIKSAVSDCRSHSRRPKRQTLCTYSNSPLELCEMTKSWYKWDICLTYSIALASLWDMKNLNFIFIRHTKGPQLMWNSRNFCHSSYFLHML